MIFVGEAVFAQKKAQKLALSYDFNETKLTFFNACKLTEGGFEDELISKKHFQNSVVFNPKGALNLISYSLITPNYYTQNFGFFCKKELQIEKAIKIPFKFRLGSLQQCDWMEGKPNAGMR